MEISTYGILIHKICNGSTLLNQLSEDDIVSFGRISKAQNDMPSIFNNEN